MNTIRTGLVLSLSTMTLCLLGCEHTDQNTASAPVPASRVASEPRMGSANAQARGVDGAVVDQLSAARCDREQSCNNVGGGQKYASRDVCMNQMRGDLANDLNAYNCPRGIDRGAMDVCMSAIRGEECAHPLDTLARVEKCRTGALCMK